jgi:hypothetical protein
MTDPGRFESDDVVVVRHDPRVTWAMAGASVLGGVLIVVAVVSRPRASVGVTLLVCGLLILLGGFFAGLCSLALRLRPREVRGHVVADSSGVYVEGALVTPPGALQGLVVPNVHETPRVVVWGHSGLPIQLVVRDVEEGRVLLRALGLGATRAWTRFEVPAVVAWRPFAYGVAVLGFVVTAFACTRGQRTAVRSSLRSWRSSPSGRRLRQEARIAARTVWSSAPTGSS